MTITVLGAGYVGLSTASLMAHAGHTVYIVEPNKTRLDAIKLGKSFFFEQGIDMLIKTAIDAKTLIPTDSYSNSITKSDVIFSCVGTPDLPDGSTNLMYVIAAAKETAKYIKPGSIYVQKSTVPVGTGQKIQVIFSSQGLDVDYVSNPEFLREGTAIFDTLFFDRIVVGGDNQKAVEKIITIYKTLERNSQAIAQLSGIAIRSHIGRYIPTSLNSAELIKVTANAFLALKISFANSIAKLADAVDADIVEVMDAVGADKRIGNSFLNAGRGYGGGCFPKDVSGLIASGAENGINLEIMQAAQTVNKSMPAYIINKMQIALGGSLKDKKIAVLGLAFKAGTSDVRRSPGIALANELVMSGVIVTSYDPQAGQEASKHLHPSITVHNLIRPAIADVDAVVIATEWPELLAFTTNDYAQTMHGGVFVDAINRFSIPDINSVGLIYVGVGR